MDFGKLAKSFLGSDSGKQILKEAKKTASASGFDLSSFVGTATKNAEFVKLLGKIGALKGENEPDDSPVQKLVKQLYSLVSKKVGFKIDEEVFSKIVTKVLSAEIVKKQVVKLAGSTTSIAFIKKAISAFVG